MVLNPCCHLAKTQWLCSRGSNPVPRHQAYHTAVAPVDHASCRDTWNKGLNYYKSHNSRHMPTPLKL
jgi:hypothetical protein